MKDNLIELLYVSDKLKEFEHTQARYYAIPDGNICKIVGTNYPNEEITYRIEYLADYKYDWEKKEVLGWRCISKKRNKWEWWPILDNNFLDVTNKVSKTIDCPRCEMWECALAKLMDKSLAEEYLKENPAISRTKKPKGKTNQ